MPMSPTERYQSDPVFTRLVQVILYLLEEDKSSQFTPTEVREAANYACVLYEQRHVKPVQLCGAACPNRPSIRCELLHEHRGMHALGFLQWVNEQERCPIIKDTPVDSSKPRARCVLPCCHKGMCRFEVLR